MRIMNLLLAAVVSAGLMFGITAQADEYKSRGIDLKTLPVAVQKTITETAAAGKIIRVYREDDRDGKWNYEAIVKTDGKEWKIEVDLNGKFLKKRPVNAKTE
jgi:uncharacterized membrane protein YkoI